MKRLVLLAMCCGFALPSAGCVRTGAAVDTDAAPPSPDILHEAGVAPSDGAFLPDTHTAGDPCEEFVPYCDDNRVLSCKDGTVVAEACVLGCSPGAQGCHVLFPSNVGDRVALDASQADAVVGAGARAHWVVDTNDGSIIAYDDLLSSTPTTETIRSAGDGVDTTSGILFQVLGVAGQPLGYAVVAVNSLQVPSGASLVFVGPRPCILLANESIVVSGMVSVGARRVATRRGPGAGGGSGARGCGFPGTGPGAGSGAPSDTEFLGGGGGSFGGRGGKGGGGGYASGDSYGTATLVPLVGGSGGGSGSQACGLDGGDAGGALQLVAGGEIDLRLGGSIDARGGGGGSGGSVYANPIAAGGGGSGGALLLEAPVVSMEGVISVNGGAGGRDNNLGADGEISFAPVLGVAEGGDGSDVQGVGGDGKGTNYAGGGGGGGGRIRINTATGTESFDRAIVLPVFDSGFATVGVVAVDH